MIEYGVLKNWPFREREHVYQARDTILYALGCGFGFDPCDRKQLAFVYEEGLKVVPTMASVIGSPGTWWRLPGTGVAWERVLHVQQELLLRKPLPTAGAMRAVSRVTHLHDRGAGRGALAGLERQIFDSSGECVAVARRVELLRDDGGFSARSIISDEAPPRLPKIASDIRGDDLEVRFATVPQAALIYRLSGDWNPLHADPDVARVAGFPKPILHGLCSFGFAAHAILRTCCNYEPESLSRIGVIFKAPVYPGDTLVFRVWKCKRRTARFRAWAAEREQLVLEDGIAEYG